MPILASATASVLLVDADAVGEACLRSYPDWLGEGELARYRRFVRAQRQRQFLVGRILLRTALGRLLDVAPRDIQLEEHPGKAPSLTAPASSGGLPGFSIAHSGRWVACAVSAQTALGLDIEMRDPGRDLPALAAQAYDDDEMVHWTRLQGMDDARRIEGFYRLWSEKEARFKLGVDVCGHCVVLPHQELSVVLCSAQPLTEAPQIEVVTLA